MRSVGISSLELWGDGEAHPLHPAQHGEADFKRVAEKLDDAGIKVSAYCTNFRNDVSADILDRAFVGCRAPGGQGHDHLQREADPRPLDAAARSTTITGGLHNHWKGDAWFVGAKKDPKAELRGPGGLRRPYRAAPSTSAINLDIGHFSAAGYDPLAYFKANHAADRLHPREGPRAGRGAQLHAASGREPRPSREFCRAMHRT